MKPSASLDKLWKGKELVAMAQHNQVKLSGNVGKDAEYHPQIGNGLASFGLAHNRYRPTEEGYAKMPAQWFRCVAWGRVAEQVARLKKGQYVSVVGRLESREWKDAKGVEHHSIEIVVERFSSELNQDKVKPQKAAEQAASGEDEVPL
jgi:single-strand DNA-binding protein